MIWLLIPLALLFGAYRPRLLFGVLKVAFFVVLVVAVGSFILALPFLWAAWEKKKKE